MTYWQSLKKSSRLYGVLFICIPIILSLKEALFNDWTYIFATLGFCIPAGILLYWQYKDYKQLNGIS